MRTRTLARTAMTFASVMAMWAAGDANAGLFRTYLSVNGSDANPCTLPSPCRLLPAAIAAANAGGEIWMLDSANFNVTTVSINKSLTILAVPGALGSVVANSADAININSPGIAVTLRNVVVLNLAGAGNTGIIFTQGSGLTLEGCEIYGLAGGVSSVAAGAAITVKDSTIRDNSGTGVFMTGASKLQLLNASVLNNGTGVAVANGAGVAVTGGTVSGSATGIQASAAGSTTTQVAISGSTITANSVGLSVTAATGGDTAAAMINKTTFTQNTTGVNITGGTATVYSLTNNAFKFNTADLGIGSLTGLAAQ